MPTAIVTGGTSGIGAAVVEGLATRGWTVVVNGLAGTPSGGHGIKLVEADVADPGTPDRLLEAAGGRVDLLLNAAATTTVVPHVDLDGLSDAAWQRILDVNLTAAWRLTKACAPALRVARGSIMNVASIAGLRVDGSSIAYAVSKAALVHLTSLLAVALAPEVRVNAVAPGYIATPWTADWPAERRTALAAAVPLGRAGGPADVADACLALLDLSYCTGTVLPVDGGLRLT